MNNLFNLSYNDLNMEIMMHLDIKDIENMCLTNNQFNNICQNKHFWIEKISHDFTYPDVKIHNIHWIHFYKTIKKVSTMMTYLKNNQDEYLEIDIDNVEKLNKYFNLLNITAEDYTLSSLVIYYSKHFNFTIVDDNLNVIQVELSKLQLYNLLIYIYYYHDYQFEHFNYFNIDEFDG